jgi:hypothetical protein
MIPILAMNRDKTIWGPDAMEFMYVRFTLLTAKKAAK